MSILLSLLRHCPNLYDLSIPCLSLHLNSELVDILTVESSCPGIRRQRFPKFQALSQEQIFRLPLAYSDFVELEFFVDYGPEVSRL